MRRHHFFERLDEGSGFPPTLAPVKRARWLGLAGAFGLTVFSGRLMAQETKVPRGPSSARDRRGSPSSLRPILLRKKKSRTLAAFAAAVIVVLGFFGLRQRSELEEPRPSDGSAVNASAALMKPGLLRLYTGAEVLVRPHAQVRILQDDASRTVLDLEMGSIVVQVTPGLHRHFVVKAGDTQVEVSGTLFAVEREPVVRVRVLRGSVRVGRGEATALVPSPGFWPPQLPPLVIEPEEIEQLAGPRLGPLGAASSLPSSSAAPSDAGSAGSSSSAPAPSVLSQERERRPGPLGFSAAPSGPSAGTEYQQAVQLERRGSLREALAKFQGITLGKSAHHQDALFAVARIHLQQGEASAALSALVRYRSEYPDGRYAQACSTHLLLLWSGSGHSREARGLAEEFLRKWPTDSRAWRFRVVRAAGRAEAGDCSGALRDVEGLPERGPVSEIKAACRKKGSGGTLP